MKETKKKQKYQRILRGKHPKPDFVTNQLLKKPRSKRSGWVYSAIDLSTHFYQGDHFLPTWDETDHLHFVCAKCKHVADVLSVKLDANYSDEVKYALFFYLGCPNCGATGQRKIYLDMRDGSAKFQCAFDDGKVYRYGNERKPAHITNIFEEAKKRAEK